MSDTSPTSPAASEQERRHRLELEQAAVDHFSRLNGALELQATVLALLLPEGSKRAARAWQAETQSAPHAAALLDHASHLSRPMRLPWLETLATRMRAQSLDARQNLLEATRRVMSARGTVRPIDRLHWMAMRQWLGEASASSTHGPAAADLSQLPQDVVSAIARYSAFLSRLVPVDAAAASEASGPPQTAPGLAWYDTVMEPWQVHGSVEPCRPPDTDRFVHALQELQALAWMQRPMVARGWVVAAQQHSRHGRLADVAADALRLSCTLLDSPMPPELARHYGGNAQGRTR